MENIKQINTYMIQKRGSFIVDSKDFTNENKISSSVLLGALANLETWAYKLDDSLIKDLSNLTEETFLQKYYNPLVETLKYMKGDDVSHDHFVFQNFPDSCKEIPLEELSAMRFARYYTVIIDDLFGTDLTNRIMDGEKPEFVERERLDDRKLEMIKAASIDDFYSLVGNLIGSKSAMSELDKQIIDFAIHDKEIPNNKIIPNEIPYKETLALMLKYDMEENLGLNIQFASYKDFKRAISILSDQEPDSKSPKLKKFSNEEKRYLLCKLEMAAMKNPDIVKAQMYADRQFVFNLAKYWKIDRLYGGIRESLKEKIKGREPLKIEQIIKSIENKEKMVTAETIKGEAVKNKDVNMLLEELKKSPGELFRRLYFLLDNAKTSKEITKILDTAEKYANKVPNDILLTTRSEIKNSTNLNIIKTAFPHGNTRNAIQFENKRGLISQEIINRVDRICSNAIIARLSTKLDFTDKKIYLSEDMKKCPVPFAIKNESAGTRTLTKGTRLKVDGLDEKEQENKDEYLRMFVYKKIPSGGFVDLSVSFLDKDCNLIDQCSWTNLKTDNSGKPLAVHSGDGHDCQNGLTEFIDIDLKVLETYAKEKGIDYVAMQVYSWNGIPFNKMDKCFAGVMKCDDMIKDKIPEKQRYKLFDPKLVKSKMDLAGSEISCVPFLYNVNSREIVVADIAIPKSGFQKSIEYDKNKHKESLMKYAERCHISPVSVENMPTLESNHSIVANVTKNIIENHYPTLYDLYEMAIIAGGAGIENIVESKEKADISFDWEGTITPYDRDVITKEYMTVENENLERLTTDKELIEKLNEEKNSTYYDDMRVIIDNIQLIKENMNLIMGNQTKNTQEEEFDER